MQDFVIIDEAHYPLGKSLIDTQCGQPKIAEAIQTARAFLVSIILSTNFPNDLLETCHVNTNKKFMLKLPDGKNIYAMGTSLGLSKKQMAYTARMDKNDYEVIISAKKPYKTKLNPFPLPLHPISNDEVNARTQQILSEYEPTKEEQAELIESNEETQKASSLSQDEKDFLMAVHLEPTLTKTKYYSFLKFSNDKGNRITKKILSKELIKEHKFCLGEKRQIIILEITEKGYQAIAVVPKKGTTRGEGKIHQYLVEIYHGQLLQRGYNAKISYKLNNKETDIGLIQKDSSTISIEISQSTPPDHEAQQAIKNLQAGYQKVLILSEKTKTEKIRHILKENNISKGKVTISEFVTEINPLISSLTGGE